MSNYFTALNAINVNGKTEKKNGLTYLSWAWAWGEVKKLHPDAVYTIYENELGWNYHTDGKTCWVKTGVTINGIEHIEYLPVMDFRNASIHVDKVTSFDVNKAIQRSLTKAVARHGLGLYIYAGEDLPEDETPVKEEPKGGYGYKESIQGLKNLDEIAATANYCAQCGTLIRDGKKKSGAVWAAVDIASYTKSKFGRCLCQSCASDASKQEN
jgi:hypothetical protein